MIGFLIAAKLVMFQILLLIEYDYRPPRALYEATPTVVARCGKIISIVNKAFLFVLNICRICI